MTRSELHAFVVIHSADGRPVTVDVDWPQDRLTVLPAQEVTEVVGSWLLPGVGILDRYLLTSLLNFDRSWAMPTQAPAGNRGSGRTGRIVRGAALGGLIGYLIAR